MSTVGDGDVFALARRVRLRFIAARSGWFVLVPEGVVALNDSAAEVLEACDGNRTVGAVIDSLAREHPEVDRETLTEGIRSVLERMAARRFVVKVTEAQT